MAGYGYGSEWHWLRYLGRHRRRLNERVLQTIGGSSVEWLDFNFNGSRTVPDAELKGLEFLPADSPARQRWRWPETANGLIWDSVGKIRIDNSEEWLLVETQASLEELRSNCDVRRTAGLRSIAAVLDSAKLALGVSPHRDWLRGHYRHCARIAALHHLTQRGIGGHLLFVYFCGDRGDSRRTCPKDPEEWAPALAEAERHIGLPDRHPLVGRVHALFLPVLGV